MSDIEHLHAALDEWNSALDAGDIDRLVATAHENVVICNEHQPTTMGVQALRNQYGPRIEAFDFKSTVDVQEVKLFGDFAVMVMGFGVQTTNKKTGETGGGSGRVILGYCRDENGAWKLALDVDNNGGQS